MRHNRVDAAVQDRVKCIGWRDTIAAADIALERKPLAFSVACGLI